MRDFDPQSRERWEHRFERLDRESVPAEPTLPMLDCVEFFKGRNVAEILDVGCGDGRWAVFLARRGFVVQGFDFSERAVRYAQAWADRENLVVEIVPGTVTEFPFEGEIFDAAVASLVLDVLTPREMAMAIDQLAARVRRGGALFALFHPYPEPGDERVRPYRDNDLRRVFPAFRLLDFRSYSGGWRGLFLKRLSSND